MLNENGFYEEEIKLQIKKNDINRINWIDIAKAFSIFSIVLGHSSTGILFKFTYSFNSVIFFVLAGITFCQSSSSDLFLKFDGRPISVFIRKNIKSILLPYFTWSIISIIIYSAIGNKVSFVANNLQVNFSLFKNLLGMIYGNSETGYFEWNRPFWFLTCLLSVEVIFYFILVFLNKIKGRVKSWIIYTLIMLFAITWMIILSVIDLNIVWPFELETALGGGCFFFGFGLLVRERVFNITRGEINVWRRKTVLLLTISVLLIANIYFTLINGTVDFRSDHYSNLGLFIINTFAGSGWIIFLSILIGRNRILEYIGNHTIEILLMHKFPLILLKLIYAHFDIDLNILTSLLISIISILLCLVVGRILSIIAPFAFGKKKVLHKFEYL